jgi:hypothetical protein
MPTTISLVDMPNETGFAPLGVLGYCLTRTQFLAPAWAKVNLALKTVDHSPADKLQDVVTSILAGCRSISQVNTEIVPDQALARAWGRDSFADQSQLARALDTFDAAQIAHLRQGTETLFRRESYSLRHDFARDWLWLDIDLTPLPASKHAEESTKGKFNKRNRYGRQLARIHAPQYHETLFSRVYAGNQESSPTYKPAVDALDAFLRLDTTQKRRTILRSDAGFGSDANVNHALKAQWQVLTKNKGGRRPKAWARQVAAQDWLSLGKERWVARAVTPPSYARPCQCLVLKWHTPSAMLKYAVLICSISAWTMAKTVAHYDDRGACETEIQADKGGLKMERRRKKRLAAQEALILLTDLAHNLAAWVRQWMFLDQPLAGFGTLRLTQDVLRLPGRLFFDQEHLTLVQLNQRHPHAEAVATGLQRLLDHFGNP